jgi:mannose-6-phosphate isomerase
MRFTLSQHGDWFVPHAYMNPLHLKPLIKRIRWGGTRLASVLGKEIGNATDAAESWEVVDHGTDQSLVLRGEHAGRTLAELVRELPRELFGDRPRPQFPLLIKFLDATDRLSLQVHPNDRQAIRFDPAENGKTEAWVILDTTPESKLWLGLKRGVQRNQLAEAVAEDRIREVVHELVPHAGDCFLVPAGTVHAIGEGILLAEVQQSSDLTFRLHDWGRVGADGKPRELHLEESLECIDFTYGPGAASVPQIRSAGEWTVEELVNCPYFRIHRHRGQGSATHAARGGFSIVMLLSGVLRYECDDTGETLRRGETILIPASSPVLHLHAPEETTWLEIDCPPEPGCS